MIAVTVCYITRAGSRSSTKCTSFALNGMTIWENSSMQNSESYFLMLRYTYTSYLFCNGSFGTGLKFICYTVATKINPMAWDEGQGNFLRSLPLSYSLPAYMTLLMRPTLLSLASYHYLEWTEWLGDWGRKEHSYVRGRMTALVHRTCFHSLGTVSD